MDLKPMILIAVLALPACATVDTAAAGIKRYCASFTWPERAAIRERVNAQIDPHKVAITCGGDDAVR